MPSDVDERVRGLLEKLRMTAALAALAELLPADKALRTSNLEAIERVLRVEVDRRREKRIIRRIEASKLPDRPTLETFDFDFQPSLDKPLVLDLATLAWIDRNEDLLLVGQSGVGKSHIAKALCLIACSQERRVLYTTCANMMVDLNSSLADGTLARRLKRYTYPQLLLIDDLGYDPLEQEQAREAQLLYKVLEARHGKLSTIVTSNLDVPAWAEYLGNQHLTVALLDRLLYHATTISITGPSYRLAQHDKRQRARTSRPSGDAAASATKPVPPSVTKKRPASKKK
jgi:DNA replication protein DnaC